MLKLPTTQPGGRNMHKVCFEKIEAETEIDVDTTDRFKVSEIGDDNEDEDETGNVITYSYKYFTDMKSKLQKLVRTSLATPDK